MKTKKLSKLLFIYWEEVDKIYSDTIKYLNKINCLIATKLSLEGCTVYVIKFQIIKRSQWNP